MTSEGFHLDGNGIAGTLGEIFTMDITSAERICHSCGTRAAPGFFPASARVIAASGQIRKRSALRNSISPTPNTSSSWFSARIRTRPSST